MISCNRKKACHQQAYKLSNYLDEGTGKDLLYNAEASMAGGARERLMALLGKDGLDAVMEIANRIIEQPLGVEEVELSLAV